MSVTETLTPRPTHVLDGIPPDKRVVIIDVTWDDYESLVEHIGESRNCRVAFDGEDIEMMTRSQSGRVGLNGGSADQRQTLAHTSR